MSYRRICAVMAVLALVALMINSAAAYTESTAVFINEFHYDNVSTDTGEFIEIACPVGTDLTGWELVLYNGYSTQRAPYNTISLSGSTIVDMGNGFGTVTINFATNGIQNGAPDGFALVDNSHVVLFLSYEGSFTAASGPAAGVTSTDIGVEESASTPAGYSLQLSGDGALYADFTWQSEQSETKGDANTGQTFSGSGCGVSPGNIWINEFHYNNIGVDVDEGVEVAGDAGIDLSCYSLAFYGGDQVHYRTDALSGTMSDLGGGYGVANFSVTGIADDEVGAIALVFDGTQVVQFLSYGASSFTGSGGPADGMSATDIGVNEYPVPLAGQSLYLTGQGTAYEDFTWTGPDTATPDAANTGQTIEDIPGGPFTIFHMNDVHSRLLPHDFDVPEQDDVPVMEQVGGAAYFAAKMLELKAADPHSLILDAGDISEGNPLGDLRGNGGMVDFYNLLDTKLKALGGRGIDAVVVGNHDVRSLEMLNNLKPLAEGGQAQFPGISVNVCHYGTTTPYFEPYVIVNVNGTRVGILGYTNDESSYLGDDLVGVIEVKRCTWDGGDINIRDWVNTLRTTENCDVVVLLSHMGQNRLVTNDYFSDYDAVIEDSGGVAPPEIVISGHWHSWTDRVWKPSNMNEKTMIAEAASYMQYIGEVNLDSAGDYVDAEKHVIRNSAIIPDADVEDLIFGTGGLVDEYNAGSPVHGLFDAIGYSAVDLTMDKDKWWTVSEYPWNATNAAGAWITDAMVWTANREGLPVDLAMQSGGGIRRDIASGEITYVEIYEAYPWSDDKLVRVEMTGTEIWDWIEEDYVGTSISDGWLVTAHDGEVIAITFNGSPVNRDSTPYNVAISEYMYEHPEIPLADTTPEDVYGSIREGVVDYTAQYDTPQNPMYPNGITPRYYLNTEFAGGFKAVVTMIADSEDEPYHEDAFIRFVEALPSTLDRREGYGLSGLVNADGSIDLTNRFSEIMLYRSHLGFTDGLLSHGDVIEVWGEGGFYNGTPEFIDQEGVNENGEEFTILYNDPNLARAEYFPNIDAFWDDDHENHFVKFYAERTGASTVQDSDGDTITVYQQDAYDTCSLPGNNGDLLELTGVNTDEGSKGRRFRCHSAVVSSTAGYPATSGVDAISPYNQAVSPMTLTATASDVSGSINQVTLTPVDDSYVMSEKPNDTTPYGGADWNLYVQQAGDDGFGNDYGNERSWVKFDLTGQIPPGATITSATLRLFNFQTFADSAMDASVHGAADGWSESTLTWNLQPSFGGAEDTITLESGSGYVDRWQEWDVTGFVTTEAAGDQTVSLVVKPVSEPSPPFTNPSSLTFKMDSKDYDGGSVAPELVIQWEDGGAGSSQPNQVEFFYRYAADKLAWGSWTSIGTDPDSGDGWGQDFTFPQGIGYYEFYSVSTDNDGNVEDAPVRSDAECLFNQPPSAPTDPIIPNGAIDVSLNPELGVTVSDPNGMPLDVYFYDGLGNLIGYVTGVPSGNAASITWNGLDPETTYEWYVVVDDGLESTPSDTWRFTTQGSEPVPSVPASGTGMLLLTLMGLLLAGAGMTMRRRV